MLDTAALLSYLIGAARLAGLGREVVGAAAGRGAAVAGARAGVAVLATLWRVSASAGARAAVGVRDTTRVGAGAA